MASDRGKQQAYCNSVSHGGVDDVRRHGEGKKHLELFNARKSTNQVTRYYVSSNSSSLDENVIKAETLISLAMAKHNVQLAFADHLAKVVKVAFPDSSIAKKYACGRGKTTQIIKPAIDLHAEKNTLSLDQIWTMIQFVPCCPPNSMLMVAAIMQL